MTRYLLPVFPIALAAAIAGISPIIHRGWRAAWFVSVGSMCLFVVFGTLGLLLYGRAALSAGIGLTSPDSYLEQHAPEYEASQFVNENLVGSGNPGKTLVFMRHLYYLRVPFVYADPQSSWGIDPRLFQTSTEWKIFFKVQDVRWVVRSPSYPKEIAVPLQRLESEGTLVPIATRVVSDFKGMRINGLREDLSVVILQVKD
jgi:hypothetical protein